MISEGGEYLTICPACGAKHPEDDGYYIGYCPTADMGVSICDQTDCFAQLEALKFWLEHEAKEDEN